MQLQRCARLLLGRSLSGLSSLGRIAVAPAESSNRCFLLPLPSGEPDYPAAHVVDLWGFPDGKHLGLCGPSGNSSGGHRGFCSGAPVEDYDKAVDEVNLKFAEAREEIDAALESKDTVYFDEEAECAREAVKAVLEMFEALRARLPEKERAALQRSMGLKMEQLKAELQQLND